MRFLPEYHYLIDRTRLVEISSGEVGAFELYQFNCGDTEYNDFLTKDAAIHDALRASKTHLLIDNETNEILGYISLNFSHVLITPQEKLISGINVPFGSLPAINIGKLASSIDRKSMKIGSYLLYLAYGLAAEIEDSGIAARFLILDADIERNEGLVSFYEKNGFIVNTHKQYTQRKNTVSMRYDLLT